MRLIRLCCAALLTGVSVSHADLPPPAQWKLPPVDGELSGEFNPVMLGGAPKLKWKLVTRTPKPRERDVELSIDGLGFKLQGSAQVDPVGEGNWKLANSEIDLREWVNWLAPRVASDELTAMAFAGLLSVAGEGTWRGGKLGGHASIGLREVRIESTKRKVLLEGVTCTLAIEDLATHRTSPSQVLTWTSGHYDVVPLGAGRIEFAMEGDKVTLKNVNISVFGGELHFSNVSFSLSHAEFTASAQVQGFEVGQLAALFPRLLARASGHLDGYMDLTRDSHGIAIGSGYLGLREGENAELQLHPTPGVLSSMLPPMINKVYPGIAKVETEGIPLKADVLQMRFVPEKDEEGRTAWLRVAGRPVDPGFKGPVDMTINIRGPLDQVLNTSAEFGLHLMGGRK